MNHWGEGVEFTRGAINAMDRPKHSMAGDMERVQGPTPQLGTMAGTVKTGNQGPHG